MASERKYHIGFGADDLEGVEVALLSGDPERAAKIAGASDDPKQNKYLERVKPLSTVRGLNSYIGRFPDGKRVVSATSGMGAPSLSIVVNELAQVGIRQIIRVGTCGSIQDDVHAGSIVITRAALCKQGAANDIAPVEYPAAANPFLTVALVNAAKKLGVEWHIGLTASVDTFYEGQGRTDTSYNKHLLHGLDDIEEQYRNLRILNFEMEAGTLFKMANVYGFAAGCVCAVIAERVQAETINDEQKKIAEENAIRVALQTVQDMDATLLDAKYWR
jgi:uridine phosphorylase